MQDTLVPIVLFTGMFAMIFGITYVRSRENMAMIEKGLNPRNKDVRPRPFINLKWGLLLIGSGLGLFFAYIIDNTMIKHDKSAATHTGITFTDHISIVKRKPLAVIDTSHVDKDTSLSTHTITKTKDDDGDNEEEQETHINNPDPDNPALYFALVAIGGGLGLFFSYRIEKKEWLDKKIAD